MLPAIALTMLLCAVQAQAQSSEERINALMRQGQFVEAYALAERAWPQGTPNRAMRLDFIRAMSLKAQGRHPEAIVVLRRINAENPSFTRVRAELAHSLYVVGDHEAARFHFTDLTRSVDDSQMRDAFDAYLAAMRRQRPYRVGAYVAIAPSTNINGRTIARTIMVNGFPIVLNPESRARSGVGLSGGISGERSFILGQELTLTVAGRFDGTKYSQTEYDKFQIAGNAFLRKRVGAHTFGAGVIADHQNQAHESYRNGLGGAVEYGRVFEGGRHLFVSARLMHYRYPGLDFLDGWRASASVVGRQTLAPGHHLTAGLRLVAERTGRDYYDYDGIGAFVSHSREWKGGLITAVEPSVMLRRYRAQDPYFNNIVRQDLELGASISLMHRKLKFKGFAPRLEYSYLRQFSNHPLQERDTHALNVVMTREF